MRTGVFWGLSVFLVVAEIPLGSCSSSHTGAVEHARQIVNGDFETGVLAPWATWQAVQAAIGSAVVHGGKFSLTETSGQGSVYQDVQGLENGVGYTVTAWICGAPGTTASGQIALWDPGTNVVTPSAWVPAGAAWQPVKVDFKASSSATIRVHLFHDGGNGSVYWDDVTVSRQE